MKFDVYEQFWFATPIWECSVTDINNEEIKDYCLQTREKMPGTIISNRGGWHSKGMLFPVTPSLAQLFNEIDTFTNQICFQNTGIPNLQLSNFWVNINGYHDYNIAHDHQKSILSGVYYVSIPEENMGNITFHRGDNAEYFLPSTSRYNPTASTALSCTKPAKESTFYLFPSWVKHSVERNESHKERISIAFNIVLKEQINT